MRAKMSPTLKGFSLPKHSEEQNTPTRCRERQRDVASGIARDIALVCFALNVEILYPDTSIKLMLH